MSYWSADQSSFFSTPVTTVNETDH